MRKKKGGEKGKREVHETGREKEERREKKGNMGVHSSLLSFSIYFCKPPKKKKKKGNEE